MNCGVAFCFLHNLEHQPKIMSTAKSTKPVSAGTSAPGSVPRMIRIFDTTLRDGEQSPGASMNIPEKLEIAQALADLGVDIIEAGFPIASPGDFEAVRQIAQIFAVRRSVVWLVATTLILTAPGRPSKALQRRGFMCSWRPARSIVNSS